MNAPLITAPNSAIPAGWRDKAKRALDANDMSPEAWRHLVAGLVEFLAEEAEELNHGDCAMDRALLAWDESVRTEDVDGRMRVAVMNISKAAVNPYKGEEIPGCDALGLDPQKVYYLYRDPEELAKAAASSNGVQILRKHIPVNAEDHQPWDTVGALGTDGVFEAPYLTNSGTFWTAEDIAGIKSGRKKQLSLGYHYRPDMMPGTIGGIPFDGVMRDITVNHVALVEDGRAGPDVVVGDSAMDDLSSFVADAEFNESDHPRAPDGKFGSGGGSGHTRTMAQHQREKEYQILARKQPHEEELTSFPAGINRHRGITLPSQEKEHRSAASEKQHSEKKAISSEALTEKLKGMSEEKLHAALKNKDVDPMIKAHIEKHLTSRLLGHDEARQWRAIERAILSL